MALRPTAIAARVRKQSSQSVTARTVRMRVSEPVPYWRREGRQVVFSAPIIPY